MRLEKNQNKKYQMIQHLPNDLFWVVAKHSNDIRACVAMWVCCKELYRKHNKKKFWEELSYQKFTECQSLTQHSSPQNVFWQNFARCNGCINCHRPFAKNKNYNSNIEHVKLNDITLFTCSTCKNILGDQLIHKKYIEPWQTNIVRKVKSWRPIFEDYYGINQIQQSNGYKTKCITCIKNIRHSLCPHFKCGACCSCKFHKSHYHQLQEDIYNIFSCMRNHTRTTIKINIKQHHQQHTIKHSYKPTKRYYCLKIET